MGPKLTDFDLAIVGSGFGGSLLALIARRLDLRVLLIEKGHHPRFAIGESTSPLANLVLEDLCREYDLGAIAPLSSYGAWKAACPNVGCGLKRGFSFYHHVVGRPFVKCANHSNELLVAASPSDRVADTHWLRADVDHFLARQAASAGVEFVEDTQVGALDFQAGGVLIHARTGERSWSARAPFLVDATGPRGLLAQQLGLGNEPWPFLPPVQALYSHFQGLPPMSAASGSSEEPPYPPERAAVHHIFDGGWIWSLRFDNGITSAGVAARPWLADELALSSGPQGWQNLLDRFPSLEFFRQAVPIRPFNTISNMPYRSQEIVGPQWA
ncbi:MAG: FAD-dependent oxidoreductase, partial [Armatimonadota bacterium]|nr:FAD-dependent oxidoreductase [Armatimonadota bacterium]